MSLWHRTSRGYVDADDINGTIAALAHAIEADPGGAAAPYYIGAHLALNLFRNHEDIRDQSVFMQLFDRQLRDNEII